MANQQGCGRVAEINPLGGGVRRRDVLLGEGIEALVGMGEGALEEALGALRAIQARAAPADLLPMPRPRRREPRRT